MANGKMEAPQIKVVTGETSFSVSTGQNGLSAIQDIAISGYTPIGCTITAVYGQSMGGSTLIVVPYIVSDSFVYFAYYSKVTGTATASYKLVYMKTD